MCVLAAGLFLCGFLPVICRSLAPYGFGCPKQSILGQTKQKTKPQGPRWDQRHAGPTLDGFLSAPWQVLFRGAEPSSVYLSLLTTLLLPASWLCVLMGWEWRRAGRTHPSPGQSLRPQRWHRGLGGREPCVLMSLEAGRRLEAERY